MKTNEELVETINDLIESDISEDYPQDVLISDFVIDLLSDEESGCCGEINRTKLWERFFSPIEVNLVRRMDGIDDFDEGPFVIEYASIILCDYLRENWNITLQDYKSGNLKPQMEVAIN